MNALTALGWHFGGILIYTLNIVHIVYNKRAFFYSITLLAVLLCVL